RSTGSEARAGIRTLATLQEHETDDGEGRKNLQDCENRSQHLYVPKSGARRGGNREEFFGFERGSTDEPAVHVRHRKEFRGVRGLHAATVLDAHEGGDLSIATRDPPAYVGMHFFGLLWR